MNQDPLHVKGLILDSSQYKDKDRIVTLLTSDHGVIKFCAKNTSKIGSKYSFVNLPFVLCDVILNDSHGFWYFKDGTIIQSNQGIMNHLEAMTVAYHIAECLKDSVWQTDISSEAYELGVYSLYALSTNPDNYKLIYSSFNWKLLSIIGMATKYEVCKKCNEPINNNKKYVMSFNDNECFCSSCNSLRNISIHQGILSGTSVLLLNYILSSEIKNIFTIKVADDVIEEIKSFTTSYLSVQLDKEYSSLSNLEKMLKRGQN